MDNTLAEFTYTKQNMRTGTKLLGFYVQDLLDLAELKAGTIKKNIELVNINLPLEEIIQTQEL
jgi:signal transduction histidine kinase